MLSEAFDVQMASMPEIVHPLGSLQVGFLGNMGIASNWVVLFLLGGCLCCGLCILTDITRPMI